MKVYISIPIKNKLYEIQKKKAEKVKETLIGNGYDAITPFDVVSSPDIPYNEAMGKCIEALLGCDAVYMCEGWVYSDGCNAEYQVARIYGKIITSE